MRWGEVWSRLSSDWSSVPRSGRARPDLSLEFLSWIPHQRCTCPPTLLSSPSSTTSSHLTSVTSLAMANALGNIYKYAIPAALAYSLAQASIYDVKGGTRAVIFDRLSGVKDTVVNEGTHFLIPWLQKSIIYDVRTKPRNISTTTGSKDLQMVSLTLRVLHRPEVSMLPKIYQVCCPWPPFLSHSTHVTAAGIGLPPVSIHPPQSNSHPTVPRPRLR
jgi:hypothetical protein